MEQGLCFQRSFREGYKVDLPESMLEIAMREIEPPFVFKLYSSAHSDRAVYVGVREFSAPEGEIALSEQLAKDLAVANGEHLVIGPVKVPKGSSMTLKYSSDDPVDFKSLLESWLPQTYTALSLGMWLRIPYLGKTHELEVTKLEPAGAPAVCIVDCDMVLDLQNESVPEDSDTAGVNSKHEELPVPELVFDAPVLIPGNKSMLMVAETPKDTEYVYVSTGSPSNVVYIGPEHATSDHSYVAVADDKPVPVKTSQLGDRLCVIAAHSVTIDTSDIKSSELKGTENDLAPVCPHCGKHVPQQSLLLHINFCERNHKKCDSCTRVFSGTKEVPNVHRQLHAITEASMAEGMTCESCHDFVSSCAYALAQHRATDCPARLKICRFCHLLLPQEQSSPLDNLQGYSGHESRCGARTAPCDICGRRFMLRQLVIHVAEHEARRRERKAPPLCSNPLCPNVLDLTSNAPQPIFGLCAHCFGPSSVLGSNTDLKLVRQRIVRRLTLQLIRGCGKTWCQNPYCPFGSGGTRKWSPSEAMRSASQLAAEEKWYFCVDESSVRRLMFVDIDDGYARGWRALAISRCNSEQEATQWLQENAVKTSDSTY